MDFWVFFAFFVGAVWDVKSRRVPNYWTFLAVAVVLLLALLGCGPPDGAAGFLIRLSVSGILFFPLFYLRLMGGGDVKWIAFLIGSLGVSSGVSVLFYGCVIGAFYGLYQAGKSLVVRNMARMEGVPLVACLFLGYLWYLVKLFLDTVDVVILP